ncbi:MAG: transcription termination factor NusA [Bacteroidia bacterium]|nr:transcription termination factor NusA [Bacteroidia bacterium]MCX7652466.1 transcription termination factor NusA [Bacteroidia bacterium]MDW8416868.1 transcription termination factor NusA [Bacteroidia bacterium]
MPRVRAAANKLLEKEKQFRQRLYAAMQEFIQQHGIPKERFADVMREAILDVLLRSEKSTDYKHSYSVIVNPDTADIQILHRRVIVADDEVEDETRQIPLSLALEKDPEAVVGEDFYEEVELSSLNRNQIDYLKARLKQQMRDLERRALYDRYIHMVGEVITGEILKATRDELIVLHEGNELSLPRSELIPGKDEYIPKDSTFGGRRSRSTSSIVKAVIHQVLDPRKAPASRPIVILSRTAPAFLEALLKLEIPEIYDGIIRIRKVVRIPGERAKVLVESYDDRIDPVGACVGVKGTRIRPVVEELRGEYIDIVPYAADIKLTISRALAPGKVMYVNVYPHRRYAKVFVPPEEYARCIGREGINVRLAQELLGYELDIREVAEYGEEEDIELTEFSDEIPEAILKALQKEGFQTAQSVLQFPIDELQKRTQIDLPTLHKVYEILQAEFEE